MVIEMSGTHLDGYHDILEMSLNLGFAYLISLHRTCVNHLKIN